MAVWCAVPWICKFGVIDPSFFEEENRAITRSTRYVSMLENFLWLRLDKIAAEHGLRNVWFQQDGATVYTTQMSFVVL